MARMPLLSILDMEPLNSSVAVFAKPMGNPFGFYRNPTHKHSENDV